MSVLGEQPDFKIVAHCSDGAGCIEAIRVFVPDIAILDASLPDMTGLEILGIVNTENLATRLTFFAASVEDMDLRTLAGAGAHAIISKDIDLEILTHILREVADGQRELHMHSSARAAFRERSASAEKALASLTDRERQIMGLVSEGLSNKEIGRRLNITDGTIKVHLHHIFQKLDVCNRTALAKLAISQNDGADLSFGSLGGGLRAWREHSIQTSAGPKSQAIDGRGGAAVPWKSPNVILSSRR